MKELKSVVVSLLMEYCKLEPSHTLFEEGERKNPIQNHCLQFVFESKSYQEQSLLVFSDSIPVNTKRYKLITLLSENLRVLSFFLASSEHKCKSIVPQRCEVYRAMINSFSF